MDSMERKHHFSIAGHAITITFKDGGNSMELLPSFSPFQTSAPPEASPLFTLTVDDGLRPSRDRDLIRKFDTGNGDTVVYKLAGGGYEYIIRDIRDRDCCLLRANAGFSQCQCALNGTRGMRSFGLNDALMLIFAFAGSHEQTVLIHASCVSHKGRAYPFIAQSGTGKSTHSNLWLKHIEGTSLVNDDNPAIRIVEGKPTLYGTPWSGKTPCYRNVSHPLGAVTRIERAAKNSIERLRPSTAFAALLPSCSSMKWDSAIFNGICDTVVRIIETVPIFTLHCLPDEEAATICHKTITSQK